MLFGLTLALFELLTYLASDAVMPAMPVVVGDLNASPEYIPHALNLYLLGGVLPGGKLGELLCLGGCALVGLAVYFLLTLALAVPEAKLVVSLARGKRD